MTEELAKYEATPSPAILMMSAIEKGLDLEKVEKAMLLQERWEANEARKAYHLAMARFKADPPEIEKDKRVSYEMTGGGTKSYNHASLANVTSKINSALSVQGLSATWDTAQGEGGRITVTCRITHEQGHSESTKLTASPDDSGKKNSIQAIGSTISYLERYTLLALTGLATHDMDNDGHGEEEMPEHITEDQVKTINAMIADKNADVIKFCALIKIESIEKMPVKKYDEAFSILKAKKRNEKKESVVQKAADDLKSIIANKNKELGVDREPGSEG